MNILTTLLQPSEREDLMVQNGVFQMCLKQLKLNSTQNLEGEVTAVSIASFTRVSHVKHVVKSEWQPRRRTQKESQVPNVKSTKPFSHFGC